MGNLSSTFWWVNQWDIKTKPPILVHKQLPYVTEETTTIDLIQENTNSIISMKATGSNIYIKPEISDK